MRTKKLAAMLLVAVSLAGCLPGGEAPSPSATPAVPTPTAAQGEPSRDVRIVAAQEFLSLRLRPDASSDRVKKLLPGTAVEVMALEGEFAHVVELATGYTGYAMTKYLVAPPEDFQIPDSYQPNEPGLYIVSAEEFLSLRESASTASEKLGTVEAGRTVEVLSFSDNFARVRVDGLEGYVLASYLEPALDDPHEGSVPRAHESGEGEDIRVVSAENYASLRVAPDTAAQRLLKLPRGKRVVFLGEEGLFSFVEDEATGERGYVLSRVLSTGEEYAKLPVIQQDDRRYVDAMEFLTLRESPSTSAGAIMTLGRGEEVTVIRREGDFAYVREKSGKLGYVLEGYLSSEPPEPTASASFIVSANEYITLREKPAASSESSQRIPTGASVELLGLDGVYARVRYQGAEGYVLSGYLRYPTKDAFRSLDIVKPTASYAPHSIGEDLAALAAKYPSQLTIVSAGRSVRNRDIPVAILGNPNAPHHILVQAAIHGREHLTATLVMAQIEDMLSAPDARFGEDTYASLLQDVCFHIFPMVNPDGALISQSQSATDGLRSIFQSDTTAGNTDLSLENYLRGWKANAAGVDLNRNFDAGWKNLSGPARPSADHYKGEAPGDQPETAALISYSIKYDFDATVSYHATGSFIYWEYGGDQTVLEQSRSLARACRAVSGYPLAGSGGVDAGGYKDWAMEMRSIPSVTIEIGTRPCPLPMDEFDMIWHRNREILPALAAWAMEN